MAMCRISFYSTRHYVECRAKSMVRFIRMILKSIAGVWSLTGQGHLHGSRLCLFEAGKQSFLDH